MNSVCKGVAFLSLLITGFVLVSCGDNDEKKTYTCDEAVDLMYDNCEIWCQGGDAGPPQPDYCDWYDEEAKDNTLNKKEATELCEEVESMSDKEGCEENLQATLSCWMENSEKQCASDCKSKWNSLLDCAYQ